MIRRLLIAVCILAGAAMLALGAVSARRETCWDLSHAPTMRADWVDQRMRLTDLPTWVKQRWTYFYSADSHAVLSYSARDVPPFHALGSAWYTRVYGQYLHARVVLDAQWWWLHPEVVQDPDKDPARYELYLEQVAHVRNHMAWMLSLAVRDESWLFRCTTSPYLQVVVRFPLIWPGILLLVYPAVALARGLLRRHLRRRKGLCLKCGYNLTGNVSGICPECGEAI